MLALLCASSAALTARGEDTFDPMSQVGPNPVLPEPQQYLFPPMHLAEVVGWKQGETPTVAPGLKIEALAQGLEHPRSLYVLPNGDILVVESKSPNVQPIQRPKDIVMGWIESWVTSGGDTGESNRITLAARRERRREAGDPQRLPRPPGFAVRRGAGRLRSLRRQYRRHHALSLQRGRHQDHRLPARSSPPLPGGPIDHHWTKSLVASRDGSLLYVGVGSNSNITENGMEAEKNRAAIWEVDRATGRWRIFASGLRNPNGLTFEPESGALWAVVNERDELGPDLVPDYMTSVKDGGFYGWPYSYYGQHVDPRVQPQRPDLVEKAIVPDYALSSHVAPLGLTFYTADSLAAKVPRRRIRRRARQLGPAAVQWLQGRVRAVQRRPSEWQGRRRRDRLFERERRSAWPPGRRGDRQNRRLADRGRRRQHRVEGDGGRTINGAADVPPAMALVSGLRFHKHTSDPWSAAAGVSAAFGSAAGGRPSRTSSFGSWLCSATRDDDRINVLPNRVCALDNRVEEHRTVRLCTS